MGLELTTRRPRVTCSTEGASRAPQIQFFLKLPLAPWVCLVWSIFHTAGSPPEPGRPWLPSPVSDILMLFLWGRGFAEREASLQEWLFTLQWGAQ